MIILLSISLPFFAKEARNVRSLRFGLPPLPSNLEVLFTSFHHVIQSALTIRCGPFPFVYNPPIIYISPRV